MAKTPSTTQEDVGNIVALEHVNVFVPDQRLAEVFYIGGLGFTRDPYIVFGPDNTWVNVGDQQFHLPTRGAQVIPGHIGLVVADLDALQQRLKRVEEKLADTEFGWSVENGYVAVTGPWGNHFRCHAPGPEFGHMAVGIPYVEFLVRPGAADGIAQFYKRVLKAPATVKRETSGDVARVRIGVDQTLVFRETPEKIREYDGHHIAVYIANFSQPYAYLKRHGLIMQDVAMNQFRFKDIVDPKTGERLMELEHEVRSMHHPMYRRDLVNRDPTISMFSYARGHDALSPVRR